MTARLNGIFTFVEAAEAGSFALAGQRLGLSRSTVGKSVARLEERLGVRLFHRTTRSQVLTDDGQAFYERCLRAVAELDAAETALAETRRGPIGVLRVTAPVLLGRRCVAPLLVELVADQPQLQLDLALTDRVLDFTEDRIDLGVRCGPLADRAGLTTRKLGSFRMVVCAAPAYLAKHPSPATPADLARHDCLAYSREGWAYDWRFQAPGGGPGDIAAIRPGGRIRLDDLEALADAATAGAGLACLPCWLVADRIRAGALAVVLDRFQPVGEDVHAVWPQARQLPARVRAAIDRLAARLPARLAAPA